LEACEGEGHVSIEHCVMGEVDLLLAALTEGLLDLIAAVTKGGGHRRRRWRRSRGLDFDYGGLGLPRRERLSASLAEAEARRVLMLAPGTRDPCKERESASAAELGRISVFALTLRTLHHNALQGPSRGRSGQVRLGCWIPQFECWKGFGEKTERTCSVKNKRSNRESTTFICECQ
jgi:hypothetical protein